MLRGGGGLRTGKLGFHALAHEPKLYVIQCPENIGGHNCLLVLKCCNLIGPAAEKQNCVSTRVGFLAGWSRERTHSLGG